MPVLTVVGSLKVTTQASELRLHRIKVSQVLFKWNVILGLRRLKSQGRVLALCFLLRYL